MPGDVLIALPSAGLHTNGYSLARQRALRRCGFQPDTVVPELGTTVGGRAARAAPLVPGRRAAAAPGASLVKGMAHITGGGITENLPRTLPEGCAAAIDLSAWTVPPLFRLIAATRRASPATRCFARSTWASA